MFKSAFLFIFFLVLNNSPTTGETVLPKDGNFASQKFWANLRIMPVKFVEKENDEDGNIRFSAIFASNLVSQNIDFVLPAKPVIEDVFFEENGDWKEKIDRKEFLKRFKKNFWLTTYLQEGDENIIVSAHQFKKWEAVKSSYAGHPERLRRSVDIPEFWEDLRMKVVFFYKAEKDRAYWLALDQIDPNEPVTPSDLEPVILADNSTVTKRVKSLDNSHFRVSGQGVFFIQKNTVFNKQEMENSKPRKILKLTMGDSRLRLQSLPLDQNYFLQNLKKHFWTCFYDSQYDSLSRVIEALQGKTEDELKK